MVLSINWERNWNQLTSSKLNLVSTRYRYSYEYKVENNDPNFPEVFGSKNNSITDDQINAVVTYQPNEEAELEFGYHMINNDISYKIEESNKIDQKILDEDETAGQHHSLHTTYKNSITNVIGLNLGIRASYYTPSKKMYFEPRIHVSYQLKPKLTLHGYFGRHHQFISQLYTFKGNSNGLNAVMWSLAAKGKDKIPVQRANILQIGFLFNDNDWLLDIQTYYKDLGGLSSRLYTIPKIPDENPQKGGATTLGADIMLKKRVEKFRLWMFYSVTRTLLDFNIPSDGKFISNYDQDPPFFYYKSIQIREL